MISSVFRYQMRGLMRLITLDLVPANPKWNPDWFTEADYANDELDRYPTGAGFHREGQCGGCLGVPRIKCSRVGLSPSSPRPEYRHRAYRPKSLTRSVARQNDSFAYHARCAPTRNTSSKMAEHLLISRRSYTVACMYYTGTLT
jgi:hypothetical protein